jgi:hypothetical protein
MPVVVGAVGDKRGVVGQDVNLPSAPLPDRVFEMTCDCILKF